MRQRERKRGERGTWVNLRDNRAGHVMHTDNTMLAWSTFELLQLLSLLTRSPARQSLYWRAVLVWMDNGQINTAPLKSSSSVISKKTMSTFWAAQVSKSIQNTGCSLLASCVYAKWAAQWKRLHWMKSTLNFVVSLTMTIKTYSYSWD